MKQCPNCGAELTDSVRFCPDCGAQMPTAPVAPVPPVPPVEQRETEAAAVSETEVAETQQPTTPEMQQPDASAVPPVYQPPQPWDASSAYQAPESFETPKKKRSALPFILGAIALLLVAGVLLFLFVDWKKPESDPKAHIERAYDKSEAAFSALFDNCTAQKAFIDTLVAMNDAEGVSAQFGLGLPYGLALSLDYSVSKDLSSQKMILTVLNPLDEAAKPLEIHVWVEEEAIIFQVPDLDDAAFSIPTDPETLRNELATSPMFGEYVSDSFMQALEAMDFSVFTEMQSAYEEYPVLMQKLADSREYVFLSKGPLSIGGTQRECWIYELGYDETIVDEIKELFVETAIAQYKAFADTEDLTDEELLDSMGFSDFEMSLEAIRIIVDENEYLVGIEIDVLLEDEQEMLSITANGAENPYTQILLETTGELDEPITCNLTPTADGFSFETRTTDGYSTLIETDSTSLRFNSTDEYGSDELELLYSVEGDVCRIELSNDVAPISISMGGVSEPLQPFDGEAPSLLTMTETELSQFLTRLAMKLFMDEGYSWLMEMMQ